MVSLKAQQAWRASYHEHVLGMLWKESIACHCCDGLTGPEVYTSQWCMFRLTECEGCLKAQMPAESKQIRGLVLPC